MRRTPFLELHLPDETRAREPAPQPLAPGIQIPFPLFRIGRIFTRIGKHDKQTDRPPVKLRQHAQQPTPRAERKARYFVTFPSSFRIAAFTWKIFRRASRTSASREERAI